MELPSGARPSGAAVGPGNSLVVADAGGSVLFAELSDSAVREDRALLDEADGPFDLQGVAMTNPESTYLYLGARGLAAILEYEWHEARKITRRFDLPGFADSSAREGVQSIRSLAWVPSESSENGGYLHVGSGNSGRVFVYELPLLEDTGPRARAQFVSSWTPLEGSRSLGGLAFGGGSIFAGYGGGAASRVLIYEALASGLPGGLREQYEVDVAGVEGMAVRRAGPSLQEVLFVGGAERAVFAYHFRFASGFELHARCAGLAPEMASRNGAPAHGPRRLRTWLSVLSAGLAAAGLLWGRPSR